MNFGNPRHFTVKTSKTKMQPKFVHEEQGDYSDSVNLTLSRSNISDYSLNSFKSSQISDRSLSNILKKKEDLKQKNYYQLVHNLSRQLQDEISSPSPRTKRLRLEQKLND